MNKLLTRQLDELLTDSTSNTDLKCESALRVGAAMLCRARPNEITAATIVCDLAAGDVTTLECVVQDIADEYGVVATLRQHGGSYSVRFSLPLSPAAKSEQPEKSVLARLLRR